MGRSEKTLHGRLDEEGEDRGEDDTDYQGPKDGGMPSKDRISARLSDEGTQKCHHAELNRGQPKDIVRRCVLPGQEDVQCDPNRTEKDQEVSRVESPMAVRTQEEKPQGGQQDRPPDIRRDRLLEEHRSHEGYKNYIHPCHEAGIRCGGELQPKGLESIGTKQKKPEDGTLQNKFEGERMFPKETQRKENKEGKPEALG